ncbi:hypothetical protein Hdeb2414_s0012g00395211 [Helianthus debilis subsp. tardiflorus]
MKMVVVIRLQLWFEVLSGSVKDDDVVLWLPTTAPGRRTDDGDSRRRRQRVMDLFRFRVLSRVLSSVASSFSHGSSSGSHQISAHNRDWGQT